MLFNNKKKQKVNISFVFDKACESINCECINNKPYGQERTKEVSSNIFRKQKVLSIKQQVTEGTFNLDKKLDIAMDRLIEVLLK